MLLREVYTALHADCCSLVAMGARALFDKVLTDMLGDGGGFERKLKQSVAEGYLTRREQSIVAHAIEAGHAASHRGFSPTTEQLGDVLEIMEHLLKGQYVLSNSSRRLKRSVPIRERAD